MDKKTNWQEFKAILEQHGIKKLYHFTDRDNLDSIITNGGLYSWADCESRGITIAKPGGSQQSRRPARRFAKLRESKFYISTSHDVCCDE